MPISQMTPDDIRGPMSVYRAGAVAAGGIISMVRSCRSSGMDEERAGRSAQHARPAGKTPRTDQDLSMKFVIGESGCALLIVVIGFLFTTVSSHLTARSFFLVSDFGYDGGDAASHLSGLLIVGWTGRHICHGALDRRHRLHRFLEWRYDLAGFEDRLSRRLDAKVSANRDLFGSLASASPLGRFCSF